MNFSSFENTISAVIFVTVALTLNCIYRWYQKKKYWSDTNVKVANPPSVIWMLLRRQHIGKYQQQLINNYGPVFGVTRSGIPVVYCADPEMISAVLSKDFAAFVNRPSTFNANDLLANVLFDLKDDKWKRIRAVVSPTFSSAKLRQMQPLIDHCLQKLVSDFNFLIAKSGNEIDVKIPFGAFTMNAVTQVAFGTKVDALLNRDNPVIVNAKQLFDRDMSFFEAIKFAILFGLPQLANILGISLLSKDSVNFFHKFTLKIIKERRNIKNGAKRYDFLQILLDANDNSEKNEKTTDYDMEDKHFVSNKTLTDTELIAQCVQFFIAGYETTVNLLTDTTYLLACHPDIQQTVYKEAKSAFESNTEIDIEMLGNLKHIDAVVCETQRLYPIGGSINRIASRDYALNYNGSDIKLIKGVTVRIPLYSMHRDAAHFPEPDSFKPERFYPENRAHHPYAYLPFGAGPRNCVARRLALMEAKLVLLYLVYNFEFATTSRTQCPIDCSTNGRLLVPKAIILSVKKR